MNTYPIHNLANIVAMAPEAEQIALTEDIERNGQTQPAVLWKGKIVDGRCRQLACQTLGIELDTRELDSKLSEDEVAKIVKSLNTRRNLTETQKVMSAVRDQKKTGDTNANSAKAWGVKERTFKNGKYIATNMPEIVDTLFNGKSVKIKDPDKNHVITTNKITTLARIIKKNKEAESFIEVDDSEKVEYYVDSALKTEKAKDEYYQIMNRLDMPGVDIKMVVGPLLVELFNLKYKENINE
jgi:hypothetical protein